MTISASTYCTTPTFTIHFIRCVALDEIAKVVKRFDVLCRLGNPGIRNLCSLDLLELSEATCMRRKGMELN